MNNPLCVSYQFGFVVMVPTLLLRHLGSLKLHLYRFDPQWRRPRLFNPGMMWGNPAAGRYLTLSWFDHVLSMQWERD